MGTKHYSHILGREALFPHFGGREALFPHFGGSEALFPHFGGREIRIFEAVPIGVEQSVERIT